MCFWGRYDQAQWGPQPLPLPKSVPQETLALYWEILYLPPSLGCPWVGGGDEKEMPGVLGWNLQDYLQALNIHCTIRVGQNSLPTYGTICSQAQYKSRWVRCVAPRGIFSEDICYLQVVGTSESTEASANGRLKPSSIKCARALGKYFKTHFDMKGSSCKKVSREIHWCQKWSEIRSSKRWTSVNTISYLGSLFFSGILDLLF